MFWGCGFEHGYLSRVRIQFFKKLRSGEEKKLIRVFSWVASGGKIAQLMTHHVVDYSKEYMFQRADFDPGILV